MLVVVLSAQGEQNPQVVVLTKVTVLIPAPRNQLPILGDCVSSKITQVGVQNTATCESHWEPTGQTPRTQYVDWLACETRCHGESENKTDQRSCALIRTRWRQPGEWEQQQARSRGSRSRPAARLSSKTSTSTTRHRAKSWCGKWPHEYAGCARTLT